MSEHTPGPWSVPHFADGETTCNCQYVLCEHYMGSICTVDYHKGSGDDDPPLDEARANARLIAAAPDMLELLRIFARTSGPEDTLAMRARGLIKQIEGSALTSPIVREGS